MNTFAQWCNQERGHTGIGLHTPADVHYELAADKTAQRRTVMADTPIRRAAL